MSYWSTLRARLLLLPSDLLSLDRSVAILLRTTCLLWTFLAFATSLIVSSLALRPALLRLSLRRSWSGISILGFISALNVAVIVPQLLEERSEPDLKGSFGVAKFSSGQLVLLACGLEDTSAVGLID